MIEVKNISKQYPLTKERSLSDISLEIREGELVGIVGSNGSGKTTLIKILANLIPYDSGDIYILGKRLNPKYVSYKGRFGFILSEPIYIEEFSVLEYLHFVARFQNVRRTEIANRINDLSKMLFLEQHLSKKIAQLSKGNQMKVSCCAALIHNPDVLIFDEPFSNLDVTTTEILLNLLRNFKHKKTILITSHHIKLLDGLCERFVVMENAKILLDQLESEVDGSITDFLLGKMKTTSETNYEIPDWLIEK